MPENDVLKRYIDAGLEFAAITQSRAEALVKDLVRVGEVRADEARDAVAELVERSRRNSERLLDLVHKEVRHQITSLGLASQADLDRLEQRIGSLLGQPTKKPTAKAAKKAAPKKSTAKKATAKKPAAKKSAKKAAVKKPAAKKASTPATPAAEPSAPSTPEA